MVGLPVKKHVLIIGQVRYASRYQRILRFDPKLLYEQDCASPRHPLDRRHAVDGRG